MPDRPLAGRVAIVTGVSRSRGIGWAIARRLASDGADLLLTGWRPHDEGWPWGPGDEPVSTLLADLAASGVRAEHVPADLAQPEAPEALVAEARERLGHVDVLVANHARSDA